MIHVYDQDFAAKSEATFHEAYMTHTSTSPNYQILASLDVGRRQVELEGYELVQKQIEMAMVLRERVATHPLLRDYLRFLTIEDLIPAEYRASGIATITAPNTAGRPGARPGPATSSSSIPPASRSPSGRRASTAIPSRRST